MPPCYARAFLTHWAMRALGLFTLAWTPCPLTLTTHAGTLRIEPSHGAPRMEPREPAVGSTLRHAPRETCSPARRLAARHAQPRLTVCPPQPSETPRDRPAECPRKRPGAPRSPANARGRPAGRPTCVKRSCGLVARSGSGRAECAVRHTARRARRRRRLDVSKTRVHTRPAGAARRGGGRPCGTNGGSGTVKNVQSPGAKRNPGAMLNGCAEATYRCRAPPSRDAPLRCRPCPGVRSRGVGCTARRTTSRGFGRAP